MKMLLVTSSPAKSLHFAEVLGSQDGASLSRANEPAAALQMVSLDKPELVIVDENMRDGAAKDFIKGLYQVNAFTSVAVLSRLSEEAFHEAYEGLGILAQLPSRPGRQEALDLLATYRRVTGAA